METEAMVRDIGKIHARLFDHRPVIGAELHQFVEEMETKSSRRIRNRDLDATLAIVEGAKQSHLPDAALLLEDHAAPLLAAVQVAARMAEKIVERSRTEHFAAEMAERRQRRTRSWNAFMESLCAESHAIERDYEEGKEKIIQFYADLEKNLD